jgi:basic amino acid/polyamine antiporter, APA family
MANIPGKTQAVLARSAVGSVGSGTAAAPAITANQLRRSFRVRDGVALIISNVVGAGVFTTIASISKLVPQPGIMLALWIAGGGLALAGAFSYAQLARRWPSAGGEYIYLANAYGPTAGFLSGWTSLIAGFSGAVAFSAVALASYLAPYFPTLASDRVLLSVNFYLGALTVSPRALTACAIILLFAVLHACNLGAGKLTQNALALLILGIIGAFCIFGFTFGTGSWSHFQSPPAALHPTRWLVAFIPIMFSYSGWNAASYISEEIHDTQRTIGRVLLTGTLIIIVLYAALNALYVYAVPSDVMQNSPDIGAVAAHALFGVGQNFLTPAIVIALLGSISAMSIAGPRVYFAMSRDGAFLPSFARVSPRFNTPALAIFLQALWSIVLVLVGGFFPIMMYTGFTILLSSGAAVVGLFYVQRHELTTNSKLWLKMVAPAIFVVACAAIVVNTIWGAPKTAAVGCLLIAAGLPVFYWSRRRKPASRLATLPGQDSQALR